MSITVQEVSTQASVDQSIILVEVQGSLNAIDSILVSSTAVDATINASTITADVQMINNAIDVSAVGLQGATGPIGATGATGPQGPSGVVSVSSPITNTGTASSAQLGFDQTAQNAVNDARYVKQTDQQIFVSNTAPANPPAQYLWVQTGLGTSGSDLTFWIGS